MQEYNNSPWGVGNVSLIYHLGYESPWIYLTIIRNTFAKDRCSERSPINFYHIPLSTEIYIQLYCISYFNNILFESLKKYSLCWDK